MVLSHIAVARACMRTMTDQGDYFVMLKRALTAISLVAAIGSMGVGAATTATAAATATGAQVGAVHKMGLTPAQANAVRKAQSYLRVSAFSRTGLIDQLVYERFSLKVATFAVDYITVSWRNQAYKKAVAYLKISAFSLDGLIEQLEYEGFTRSQAVYGANRAY